MNMQFTELDKNHIYVTRSIKLTALRMGVTVDPTSIVDAVYETGSGKWVGVKDIDGVGKDRRKEMLAKFPNNQTYLKNFDGSRTFIGVDFPDIGAAEPLAEVVDFLYVPLDYDKS